VNRQPKAKSSLMSDSADCYAAIAVRPDGLVPRDRLATDLEPSRRSVNLAEVANYSLVIDVFGMANSTLNVLGSIYGQDEPVTRRVRPPHV
jgi:hypothetical protein